MNNTLSKQERMAKARTHHHMPEQRRAEAKKRAEVRAKRTSEQQLAILAGRGANPTCREAMRLRAAKKAIAA